MKLKHIVSMLCLLLVGQTVAKDYSGAEVFTLETYKYGKFEVRMRMAGVPGSVSSSFLYYNDSYKGSPEPWREVDVEILGKSPESFQSNIITGDAAQKIMSEEHHDFVGANATEGYHTYAMIWTPDYLAWTLDGVEVRRTTGQQVTDLQDKEQNWRFNLWVSSIVSWVGSFDEATLPIYQFINWTKYYKYIPENAENPFVLEWTDEFEDFDNNRWGTANWTFDENLVDFNPDNALVKDGNLILALTVAGEEGFNGVVPTDANVSPIIQSSIPSLQLLKNEDSFKLISAASNLSHVEVYTSSGQMVKSLSLNNKVEHEGRSIYKFEINSLKSMQKYWIQVKNTKGQFVAKSSLIL